MRHSTKSAVSEFFHSGHLTITEPDAIGRVRPVVDIGLATALYRRLPAVVVRTKHRTEEEQRTGMIVVGTYNRTFADSQVGIESYVASLVSPHV